MLWRRIRQLLPHLPLFFRCSNRCLVNLPHLQPLCSSFLRRKERLGLGVSVPTLLPLRILSCFTAAAPMAQMCEFHSSSLSPFYLSPVSLSYFRWRRNGAAAAVISLMSLTLLFYSSDGFLPSPHFNSTEEAAAINGVFATGSAEHLLSQQSVSAAAANFGNKLQSQKHYAPVQPEEEQSKIVSSLYPSKDPIEDVLAFGNVGNYVAALVLDGHGGRKIAEIVGDTLISRLAEYLQTLPKANIREAIYNVFLEIDSELEAYTRLQAYYHNEGATMIGAVGLLALVNTTDIVIASSGDCSAVLFRDGKPIPLNKLHNCNLKDEQERLFKEHPNESHLIKCHFPSSKRGNNSHSPKWISHPISEVRNIGNCYVKGRLNPTRSFGDFYLKTEELSPVKLPNFRVVLRNDINAPKGHDVVVDAKSFPYISVAPEIQIYPRHPLDEFILISSDGIVDSFEQNIEEIFNVISGVLKNDPHNYQKAIDQVIDEALRRSAKAAGLSFKTVKALLPGGQRNAVHDDFSIAIIPLKSNPYKA